MKRGLLIFLTLSIVASFSSCSKIDLYHDLSEEEANDILVVLQQEGISTNKIKEVRQNEVFWTISVDPKRIGDARRLLVEHNLPRKRELGLSGVYKEKGLIPTPDEQKARFLLALKGEIINSIMKIPDVVDADVILNIPSPEEFGSTNTQAKRPTASVLVKAKPTNTAHESLTESKVQQFVANAVENLNPRDVSVIISYIVQPKDGLLPGQSLILPTTTAGLEKEETTPVTRIAGLDIISGSQGRLKVYLIIFFVLLAVLAAGLIITVVRASRMRQELFEFKGGDTKQLVEGKVLEDRPKLPEGK